MTAYLQSIPPSRRVKLEGLLNSESYDDVGKLSRIGTAQYHERLLDDLLNRCMGDFEQGEHSAADSWLAPRLHAALRISRHTAADTGIWAWLATGPARKYVEWRFPRNEESTWWRYTSSDLMRNALSRLWWGAEITRSGPDYSVTELAFAKVRSFMFVSELQYSWYREAARAFARVLSDYDAHGRKEPDNLSKLFNVYLRTQALEIWSASAGVIDLVGPDQKWIETPVSLSELVGPLHKVVGPSSGISNYVAEERLYAWLSRLLEKLREEQVQE